VKSSSLLLQQVNDQRTIFPLSQVFTLQCMQQKELKKWMGSFFPFDVRGFWRGARAKGREDNGFGLGFGLCFGPLPLGIGPAPGRRRPTSDSRDRTVTASVHFLFIFLSSPVFTT
jgi:hypothetical protein